MRTTRMRVGKMRCPNCLGNVPSAAKACRHCGHAFSQEQLDKQAMFEKRLERARPYVSVGLLAVLLAVGTCSYREATRPPTVAEVAAKQGREQDAAKLLARASAGAAIKQRLKNPASFDLVEDVANAGKADDGKPCWIVAITYRGTNSFGGVMTQRALVWVSADGETPFRVVDIADERIK